MKISTRTLLLFIFLLCLQTIVKAQCTVSAGNDQTVCLNSSLSITATTNGGTATSFSWISIPAGTTSSTSTVNIPTGTAGITSYVVTANFGAGCSNSSATDTVKVTVVNYPTASFTASPNNQCASVPVSFSNGSSGTGLSYAWNFGDPNSGSNNTSTATNPIHHFIGTPGNGTQNFNVQLIVTSNAGCKDTANTVVTVKQSPGSELGGSGSIGNNTFTSCSSSNTSAPFTFTNLSSTTGTNTNYTIVWGDASPNFSSASFLTANHTYSIGSYSLLFIVNGGNGCIDTGRYTVFVGSNPAVGLNNPGNTSICSGSPLTFPISGTATNSPGTTYTVTFNDGSAPVNLTHPPPASVTHVFNNTSCGTTSSDGSNTYPNSFSAVIVASNPCATSSSAVVPIYISEKPDAQFNIIPGDTVCVNNTVTFNNTSLAGNTIQSNGTCTPGKIVWSVTPATGWSVVSGTFGNDFGLADPATWLGGSNTIQLNFSVVGNYTIKLKTGSNNLCGYDSIEKTICVNPIPVADFNIDQTIGCSPLTVITTNNSSTAFCGNNRFNWAVTYAATAGCTPSTSGYSYINGTSASSVNPQFQFTNPGVYTISLTAIAPAAACSSLVVSKQVTVKAKPIVNITAPSSVCQNQSINPTATASCYTSGATYAWTFTGGSPSSSNSSTPGNVTYNNTGTYNISLDVTNECGTTNASQPISVNNVTPSNAGPSQNVCGSSITLAGNTATVGTGTWTFVSGPNTPTITTPSSPTSTVTGLIPGTYVFQWTIANGSCTSSSTVTIIISAGPTAANAGLDQQLCLNTSTNLIANIPTIGTGQWSFVSGPNTPTIATPSSNNTVVSGLIPGTYVFRWTISFSNCTPSTDDVQVIIYDNPSAANAGSNQNICASSATLNGNTPAIGTGIWSLISGPNTPSFSNVNAPNCIISNLIAGTYQIKWSISNGPCPSSADTVQIDVIATPSTAFAGIDQRVCALTTVNLNGNIPTSGSGQWTFVSGPAGSTITNPSSPNTTVTGLVTGIYIFRWTITNGICPPSSDDVQVIIDQDVNTANAGPAQNLCGNIVTMAANAATVGNGLWTYVSGPAGSVITTPGSPTTTITNLVPGSYIFRWTISNGSCSSSSDVNIIISSGPTTANAGLNQEFCLATSTTLTANNPTIGTGLWSFVSGPAGSTITTPNSSSTTVTGLVPGIYIFRWTISFSNCTPSSDDVQVTIYDNPTTANAGNDQIICIPNATVSGNTATIGSGIWTFISGPNTPTIATATNNSTNITGLVQGVYQFGWTISNGVCPPSKDTVQITVTGISNNSISANQQICINTAAALITGSVPTGGNGSFSYQWQQSTDGGITWSNISGANAADYAPGILTVSTCYRRIVNTNLCNGPQANISTPVCVTVNPDAKALFSFTRDTACAPFVLNISNTSPANTNGTYNWYANNSFIGTGNAFPGYTIPAASNSVTIKLVAISAYGCKSDSTQHSFYTLPTPVPSFTLSDTVGCGPLTVSFNNTSVLIDTFSYFWDFANGQTSTLQQPGSITFATNPNFGDTVYTVKLYAYNECDTVIYQKNIRVQSKPHAAINPSSTLGCSPMHVTFSNNSQGLGVTYYWNFGDGTKDTTYNNNNVQHTYNTGFIDTFTVTLIAVNICGSDTQHVDIVVTPINIQPAVVINGSELFGCAPHTVTFINNSTGASQLFWDFGDGTPVVTTPNSQVQVPHTYFSSGIFTISIKLQNNCTDTTITKQVTVYTPPVASFGLNKTLACIGDTISTNNTSQNANAYEWFWGDNTSTVGFNATHIYNSAGTYTVTLVAKRTNNFGVACTDTSAATIVTVLAPIRAQINIDPNIKPCAPYLLNVSAANSAGASTIQWVFYDSSSSPGVFYQSGASASYIFNKAGTYSVKLIIKNAAGCVDSTTQTFTVYKKPTLSFTPVNVKTCNTDTTASFSVTVNYTGTDPVNVKWFINDQLAGQSNPFIYHFTATAGVQASNVFNIKVVAENAAGCGDTSSFGSFTIQTIARPRISVSPAFVQEQPNYTFTFKDTVATGPNKVYLWMPGDRNGLQLGGQQITYTYGDTGTYHVKLIVTDFETGCWEKDSVQVTILYVPGFLYVPDAFCPGCAKAELRQFLPLGKGLKTYRLRIFNTWGQKIFETTSLDANGSPDKGWDGRWNGQPVQQDAFGWQIEATYINDTEWKGMKYPGSNRYVKSGFITVVR